MAGMVMGAPRQAGQTAGVSLGVLITAEGEQKKGSGGEEGEIQEGLIIRPLLLCPINALVNSADYERNQELQSLMILHQRVQKAGGKKKFPKEPLSSPR